MSTHRSTCSEVIDSLLRQRAQRRLRERDRWVIHMIDTTLGDLEELLLVGKKKVPESFLWPLARVTAAVPHEMREELRTGVGITRVMDNLYTIQERVLRRKVRRTRLMAEHQRLLDAGAGHSPYAVKLRAQLAHL